MFVVIGTPVSRRAAEISAPGIPPVVRPRLLSIVAIGRWKVQVTGSVNWRAALPG